MFIIYSFFKILLYSFTIIIHHPKVGLRGCISLTGRFLVPFNHFLEILLDSFAFSIHLPKVVLCIYVSCFCLGLGFFKS